MNNMAGAGAAVETLLVAALALPPADRAKLAEHLLSSLEPAIDPARQQKWLLETEDRAAAIDRGDLPMLSRQEVMDKYLGDFST